VAIKEFLGGRQVFTAAEFRARFPGSQTDRNLLSRAVANGTVDKVRRGTYVSKTGRFAGVAADPFDVAHAAVPDAVFCYTSALELLGAAHNVTRQIQFFTDSGVGPFAYDGVRYLPYHAKGTRLAPQDVLTPSGRGYRVTSKEQTLVDCLANLAAAAGPDHLLHSLAALTRLDAALAATVAARSAYSVRARLGWTLETKQEQWRVPGATLATLAESLGAGPYYFWSAARPRDRYWVRRWRLYLPHPEQEMASWLVN
jgi:predicted transcriptional regulator of viral defense system